MKKLRILTKITGSGVVAIIRTESTDQAERIAEACAAGGLTCIEITFTVPGAANVIRSLVRRYSSGEVAIGAGTVLDPETARIAILEGAQFLVSPGLNADVGRLCRRYQVPYLPGAGSIQEMIVAMEEGADIIKIFPGEVLGPGFVHAARGPLPDAPMMPTGGVSLKTAGDWIRAGCVAVGVGGSLTQGAKTGDFASITETSRAFVEAVRQAREA